MIKEKTTDDCLKYLEGKGITFDDDISILYTTEYYWNEFLREKPEQDFIIKRRNGKWEAGCSGTTIGQAENIQLACLLLLCDIVEEHGVIYA